MELVEFLRSVFPYLKLVFPYLKPLLYQLLPYEIRLGKLTKGVNKLRKEKNRVQNKVREEEKSRGRAIDDDVIEWLKKVDGVLSVYDKFLEDEDRPYAVCSDGYLPKPAIRYELGRIVNHITRRVDVLLQTANHDHFSYWLGPPSFDADFDNIRYESYASRKQTMDDIVAALAGSNIGMIGVYGWSGVGKTSLIKEVAKRVKGKMFDVVIMVNVTSRPDIRSIQGQIADKLGMKLEEESESGRAARLQERLKNAKEKTLVILDNIGVKLDFNMLGIPSENKDGSLMNHKKKNPSAHHSYAMKTEEFDASSLMRIEEPLARYIGCKILMISDSEPVLLTQMDGKGIQTFCVKPLMEKEAETMFKTMAEIGDGNSLFETLAAQIAKKCKGLPMTIVTTANALKNKSLPVWEDAYLKLERPSLTAMPEFSTTLSYNLLENEELKHTFLLCARMGNDALITDLVRYCIGLGLLQGIYTVREARYRVHALVGRLKELSLLSESFSSDRFTMQDIIRDAALSIASQQMQAFAVTKGKLDEWPGVDKLERYTAISLQHCDVSDIIGEFPVSINCFRLKVFHLDNKDPHLEIPDNFFNGMKELRVLILIGIHLSSLPSSIKCLKKLRMLCLERCKLGEDLSIIGELEKLRVLSLSGSDIDCLPDELRKLAKLQIFDMSNCFKLQVIPADVMSSLISLEELYVGNSPIQWTDDDGLGNQSGENASLSELRQLNQLTTLDIQIPKITHLPKNLFFDKLDSYRIVIRDFNAYPVWDLKMVEMCEASRNLVLQLEEGLNIHDQKEIKILFGRVENLLLGQLNDVEDIFYELNYEGFPYLKYLSIVSNSKVQSIINSKNQEHLEKAFPKLESLFLYEVNNMEHICQSQLTHDSFCKLKIIKLKICGQLKNVFFSSMIKHLSVLETIEVSECNTLKEIVTLDSIEDEIKFPELRSLKLQSLSEFIGFYTRVSSTGEQVLYKKPDELFDEKVVVFKLERMELSSLKIQNIWCDQPLTRSYFENLKHLDVNDCWNLRYLLSFSMSKSLVNLQSLFVSECGMMENIFVDIQMEVSIIEIEQESIFPKLKNINLRSMKRLKEIWHPKFPLHSFGKLDALIIEGCDKLENVFPSYMVGRFSSLCNLRVTNCKSMNEIFDLKGCRKQDAEDMSNLQSVHVEALPKLELVWNKDPAGILNFEKLKKIWVQECLNLKHILPVSVAMGLKELEYLEVWNCGQLKEIVSRGETINNMSNILFGFPKLTTARFFKLPNLESFYGGTREIHFSALNNLSVELCHKLDLFRKENANPEIKPIFLPGKVIYNLKSMQIELRDANWLVTYMGSYRMHRLEEFQLSRLVDTKILYFFLHRNPNLKSLLLSNCFFEQLVPLRSHNKEKSGVVPKLKSFKLMNLPSLKMIGFEEDTVLFQSLECLTLKECPCLKIIAPSSVSFTYLTNLEVSNCNKLSHLMTPSTAKSLVQLTTMKVIHCESMRTIVSKPENQERIIFRQLKEIELVALRKLRSFCSFNGCEFGFPSLEKFVVSACGNMQRFSFSEQVKTPILRQICVTHTKEEKRYYWKGDLNATFQHMHKISAFDPNKIAASHLNKSLESRLNTLELENCELELLALPAPDIPSLKNSEQLDLEVHTIVNAEALVPYKMAASHPYKLLESSRLKTLKLANCELGSHTIPTVIFLSLKNLEELEVRSINVEVIFGIKEPDMKGYTFPLKKLTLYELPNLKRVWDKEREGILSFPNLQEVLVTNCKNLETLFPTELAKKVEKLEKLEISHCETFLKIVEEENATTEAIEEFLLPRLTSLDLCMLPQLTCFYPGRFTLECPDLNHLEVLFCGDLETFQSQQEVQGSTSVNRQPLFSEEKAIFILESLKLDWKNTMMLSNGNYPEDMLQKLTELELDFDDVNEVSNFPVELLEKASNLESLQISQCSGLEELFPSQPKQGEIRMHGHLKTLSLVCKELQKLCVSSCPYLTTFEHSAVSFSNLKQLSIKDCHGLKFLFTSSTARKLVHLEEMYVVQCESMEEILARELEETTSEAIKFERLNTIVLDSLPSLLCFYSGTDALLLSSLIKVLIWKCPDMKIFSRGVIDAESFLGIQVSLDPKEVLLFHQDLNTTVKGLFERQKFHEAVDKTCFFKNRELRADWHGKVGLQNSWLCHLVTLMLHNCTLPYAIPSSILSYLKKLEVLKVWNSDEVEVIFDINDTEIMKTTSHLKKLTLQSLSKLVRLWEKNSQRVLIFPNLQEVVVSDCENLQTLFPAPLAKNLEMLGKLEIKFCHKLQEIVEMEEGTAANITEKFEFSRLKKLFLRDLPQVTYFYPQTFTLECSALNSLFVLDCDKLELFQSAHPTDGAEGGGVSINRQPLISNLEVISNLEELILDWKHISALSLRFESEQFTEGLKALQQIILVFRADENEKPIFPIEILRKAPNLTEMVIGYCRSPEIFLAENPKIGEDGMLGQLEVLTLSQIFEQQSIRSEDSSWLNTICEKLHELIVNQCPHLTTLAHSTSKGSFTCLKKVSISNCDNLQYLFTSSVAKKLMNLEEITVKECESVKEIVAKEGDDDEHKGEGEDDKDKNENEMIFWKLEILTLDSLPKFESFYTGSSTLNFPSLKEVMFTECYSRKLFRRGDEVPTKLKVIVDGVHWEGDINSAIVQQFEKEAA